VGSVNRRPVRLQVKDEQIVVIAGGADFNQGRPAERRLVDTGQLLLTKLVGFRRGQ